MGTGIQRVYPAQNRSLAERIVESGGALVSQFWAGLAAGALVVSAAQRGDERDGGRHRRDRGLEHTSGAKMQARLALEHGKRLFLIESLVLHEQWARDYAQRPGATVVQSVDDVLTALESELQPLSEQLTLG